MNLSPLVDGSESAADEFDLLVARTGGVQPWRRVFHALNGLVLALAPGALGLSRPLLLGLLGGIFLLLLAFDLLRLRIPRINRIFFRLLNRLVSPREAVGIASSTWYALGALIAWALYPAEAAAGAILVLAFADPVAGVVGRLRGRRALGKGSVEGTAAFFLIALLTLKLSMGLPGALVGAAVAAAVEVIPGLVDDNLVVPVATGAAISIFL